MPTRIGDIRRQDLTEAAFLTLQQHGLRGTTIARVGAQAGMSPGIVHHYFKNKAELLEATMRRTGAKLSKEVIALLRKATTPRERLYAIIEGNFAPDTFTPEIAHAWLSFCAEVPVNPQFARIQRVLQRRMHSNLMHCLRQLLPLEKAIAVAGTISVLIDGFWLRRGLKDEAFSRQQALKQMRDYLDQHVPETSNPEA
ncbi:MAG: transcriptional regulator BetI [Gammaproteobacteria bacterium]|nr:transcriptional regulator BetI [Gammaproteobacteria bacterium]